MSGGNGNAGEMQPSYEEDPKRVRVGTPAKYFGMLRINIQKAGESFRGRGKLGPSVYKNHSAEIFSLPAKKAKNSAILLKEPNLDVETTLGIATRRIVRVCTVLIG